MPDPRSAGSGAVRGAAVAGDAHESATEVTTTAHPVNGFVPKPLILLPGLCRSAQRAA